MMQHARIIHNQMSEQTYKLFRGWIFSIWLAIILLTPILDLADLQVLAPYSVGFFVKYWPVAFKNLLYTKPFLLFLKTMLIVTLVCLIKRCHSITSGILFCILLTVYQGMIRGISHVHHGELALMYAVYFFVLYEWADRFCIERSENKDRAGISDKGLPVIATLTVLCFTYTFIGVHRFVYGGMDIFLNDSLIYWNIENASEPKWSNVWQFGLLLIERPWVQTILKIGFPVCTVVEILAPVALISRKFCIFFIIVMVCFHIYNWMFMGIFFWENILLFVLFYEPTAKRPKFAN